MQTTHCTAIQFHLDLLMMYCHTKFAEYLEFIYPLELEIKETTESATSASYLDCYLDIDNGKTATRLYDKRDHHAYMSV